MTTSISPTCERVRRARPSPVYPRPCPHPIGTSQTSSGSHASLAASPRILRLIAIGIVVAATGCFWPYVRKAENEPQPAPSPTLALGLVVEFNNGAFVGIVNVIVDALQNSELDRFGRGATTLIGTTLAAHGYLLAFDRERSRALNKYGSYGNRSDSTTVALTGKWAHPETSSWTPQSVDSLLVRPADIVRRIAVAGRVEYFAFASVSISDGGNIFKEPWVTVRISVYNQRAKKVLDLAGRGVGQSSFYFSNRSPPNLELALTRAFEQLETIAVEEL